MRRPRRYIPPQPTPVSWVREERTPDGYFDRDPVPKAMSNPVFWRWFDALSPAQRQLLNEAQSGRDFLFKMDLLTGRQRRV